MQTYNEEPRQGLYDNCYGRDACLWHTSTAAWVEALPSMSACVTFGIFVK